MSQATKPIAYSPRLLGLLLAIAAVLAIGVFMARNAAEDVRTAIPDAERVQVLAVARTHWDNPLQRLAYVDLAVTLDGQSVHCGTQYTVEAFTVFGLRLARVDVNDCGVSGR